MLVDSSKDVKSIFRNILDCCGCVLIFQAHLSLQSEHHPVEDTSASNEERSCSLLIEICKNIISAFKNMKTADK